MARGRQAWGDDIREEDASSLLNVNDFVSVAVGSDAALVAEGDNIPDLLPQQNGESNSTTQSLAHPSPSSSSLEKDQQQQQQLPAGTAYARYLGQEDEEVLVVQTARAEEEEDPETTSSRESEEGGGDLPAEDGDFSFGVVEPLPSTIEYRHSFVSEKTKKDGEDALLYSTPTKGSNNNNNNNNTSASNAASSSKVLSSSAEDLRHKKVGSAMAMAVRDRLMLRIQNLAEKGSISASQRGYLDNLVKSPNNSSSKSSKSSSSAGGTTGGSAKLSRSVSASSAAARAVGTKVVEKEQQAKDDFSFPKTSNNTTIIKKSTTHKSHKGRPVRKHRKATKTKDEIGGSPQKEAVAAESMYTPAPPSDN